jgi:hypothetical protein
MGLTLWGFTINHGGTVLHKSGVISLLGMVFVLVQGASALTDGSYDFGRNNNNNRNSRPNRRPSNTDLGIEKSNTPTNDSDLVRAVNDRRDVNFVAAGDVTVVEILPDDNSGLRHQKWKIRLSSGKDVLAVYNIDMGQKIPMKIGDKMALAGQFKMTDIGPLIHWLHYDPRGTRPDGWVEINGVRYGGPQH